MTSVLERARRGRRSKASRKSGGSARGNELAYRGADRIAASLRRRYRTVWISDTHLGTKGCQSESLLAFLRSTESDELFLVGDIVDGWRLRKSWFWDEAHNRIVSTILEKSDNGTRVTYVCGNHDEGLRRYLGVVCGGIRLTDEAVHHTADGRALLVLHGDRFDACIRSAKWLAILGDHAYRAVLVLNVWFNKARRLFGRPYWSLSAYLKHKVKNAVSYISSFEEAVAREAQERGFDGVVCGHIHHATIRDVDGVLYCNDGDWVESCTAMVEDWRGRLSIVRWGADGLVEELSEARLEHSEAACAS